MNFVMKFGAMLIAITVTGSALAAPYLPVGPQQNVPINTVTEGGWTECFRESYHNSGSPIDAIIAGCQGRNLMMACAPVGSSEFTVLAQAPREDVTYPTAGSSNREDFHTANGTNWYFNDHWSWGFAKEGQYVSTNSCDTGTSNQHGEGYGSDENRLCWHARGGYVNGGWSCGASAFIQGSNPADYERVLLVSSPISNPDPALVVQDGSVVESDSSSTVEFEVSLSEPSAGSVSFDYHTEDGSAIAGEDYQGAVTTSVTIPAGNTGVTISIPVYGDTLHELDETFLVIISNLSGATLADADDMAEGIILNDDAAPEVAISLSRNRVYEDPSRRRASSSITATLSAVSGLDTEVSFELDGEAVLGEDFTLPTLIVPAGSLSASVELTAIDDGVNEPVEAAILRFGGVDYVVKIHSPRVRGGSRG